MQEMGAIAPSPGPSQMLSRQNTSLRTLGIAIATAGLGMEGRRWCGSG